MPEFTVEDLVGEAVEGKGERILKDVKGEIKISAEEGEPKEVFAEIEGGDDAVIFVSEEDREEFGDRKVKVEVDFEGFEKLEEEIPEKGLEDKEKLPIKLKPKRFTKKMKKEALVVAWPAKVKAMKARLTP